MKRYLYFIFIIWLIGIFIALAYWLPLLSVILKHIPDVGLLLIILLASYTIGAQFFALIKLDFNSSIESVPYYTAFGLGFLAYCTLFLGLLGLFYKLIFYALLLLPIALSYKKITALALEYRRKDYNVLKQWISFNGYLSFILLFFIFLSLGISFVISLSPPKFFDALGYHLAIPNQYLIIGKIVYFPHSALSNYPFLIQMLFTMALLLKGEILAKLIVFAFFPLTLIAIYGISRHFWSSATSIYATAIAATIPSAIQMATLAMVDLPLAFFLLLALFSLIYWIKKFSYKWLIASSIFSGFALGIKYTAFFYALGLLSILIILYGFMNKRGIKNIIKALLIFAIITIIVSSPWWIKNYVYTGNPFFPAFYKYFGGKNWSQAQETKLQQNTANDIIDKLDILSLLKIPLLLNVNPIIFGLVGSSPGVILFIFFPLLFFYIKKEKLIQILLSFSSLFLIIWLLTFKQGRFALAMFFCLAIVLGYSFREFLLNIKHYWRVLLCALLIFFIFINYTIFYKNHKRIFDPFPYLLDLETKEQYLTRAIGAYPAISYINRNLPKDAVILFIGETRNFYCQRRVIAPSAHDINPLIKVLENTNESSQVAQKLTQSGITHILFSQKEVARLQTSFNITFDWSIEIKEKLIHFFNSQCEILFQQDGVFVLEITKSKIEENYLP
jgi:hypothetical protein